MANIKKIKIPGYDTSYEIEALHFHASSNLDTPAQWKQYIDAKGSFTIYTDLIDSTLPTPNYRVWQEYKNGIVLCNNGETSETGSYVEWIIVELSGDPDPTYEWEKVGTTAADLIEYVKKNTTYSAAALSNGSHTHTYTQTTVTVDDSKKLGATASGTAVGANGTATVVTNAIKGVTLSSSTSLGGTQYVESISGSAPSLTGDKTFVKSYPGATSKLVTTTVLGITSDVETASKATAGTAITVAKRAASQTTVGNANVGTAVSIPNVTGNSNVSATNIATPGVTTITEVSAKTAGTAASWNATVDTDGLLTISWTANTPTAITTADVTGVVYSGASTPSATAVSASKVTLGTAISVTPATTSTTKIYGCGDTASITPYTFTDVDVPVAAETATTVATGTLSSTGSGASVMTGLGTATTGTVGISGGSYTPTTKYLSASGTALENSDKTTVLTGVKVTAQPTITITENATNTGPKNEHVTVTSNASATTGSSGAHTHDVKVS